MFFTNGFKKLKSCFYLCKRNKEMVCTSTTMKHNGEGQLGPEGWKGLMAVSWS